MRFSSRSTIDAGAVRSYHVSSPPSGSLTPVIQGYQIWSTVLGSVVNTLSAAGELQGMNVYAGGTWIASRRVYEDGGVTHETIGFRTADPVTGTLGNFRYSSQIGNATTVEHVEPLGQKLHELDPDSYTPPGPDLMLRSADDPEWQCSENARFAGDTFDDLPFHCQRRLIEDLSVGLADLFGFSSKNKESPAALVDSPLPSFDFHTSPSENVLAYSRASSAKPNDDPESPKNRRKRRFEVAVTAEYSPIDISDTGWTDASDGSLLTPPDDQFKFNLVSLASETALVERIKAVVFDAKALSEECTKAFEAVGATPIREQLAQDNLRFITESVFMNSQNDYFWKPDQEFADAMRSKAKTKVRHYLGIGPAITGVIEAGDITYESNGGVYNGLRYIGITNYGTKETIEHFSVTLIHALVHSGGVEGKSGGTTDLHYLEDKYDAIIDACQKNKPRVKRAGGN